MAKKLTGKMSVIFDAEKPLMIEFNRTRISFGQALRKAVAGMVIVPISRPSAMVEVLRKGERYKFRGREYDQGELTQKLLKLGFKFSWQGVSWVQCYQIKR